MIDIIRKMADKNIGSLSLFLNNEKNIDYLNFLNSNIPEDILEFKTSEKVFYLLNDIKELLLCECGKHRSFIGFKNGYRPTCSDKKCFVKRRRETCLLKYGVDNPKKSKEIIEKEKENIKIKWGLNHYMLSEEVRDKFKKTMLDNFGVEWAQQSKEVNNKSKKTWYNNPNRKEIRKNRKNSFILLDKEKINNKRKKTIEKKWGSYQEFIKYRLDCISKKSIKNYGVDHHFKSKEVILKRTETYKNNILNKIKEKLPEHLKFYSKFDNKNGTDSILQLSCEKCNSFFDINRQLFNFRHISNVEICLNCNPILFGKSNKELEVYNFINSHYNGIILTNKKELIDLEIDIYLPEINLAFEFNGLYWHSNLFKDKYYHLNKSNSCNSKNTKLIHIWEDDWSYKSDIVKSIILNKIGKSERIFARKCQVKEINDSKLVRKFLNENHIQGFVASKIKLGLFYKNELVSLMTFGKLRKSLGHQSKEGNYEMIRFCNKLNKTVIGGASKLFKYFIKKYSPKEVISYSDSSRSDGNLYKKLGFKSEHETEPNYYWIIGGFRKHRFNYRKDKLVKNGADPNKTEVEIMNEMGYYRIFDCGSRKWSYNNFIL